MECLFGDRIPLPISNDMTAIKTSNPQNTKSVQRFIFDSQGKTIIRGKLKKLLYNHKSKVYSIMMELMLLKRHNYTDVVNMPGNIDDIVKFATFFEICVEDKRNLRRIIDYCSTLDFKGHPESLSGNDVDLDTECIAVDTGVFLGTS